MCSGTAMNETESASALREGDWLYISVISTCASWVSKTSACYTVGTWYIFAKCMSVNNRLLVTID